MRLAPALALLLAAAVEAAAASVTLRGQVVDARTREPVPYAAVRVSSGGRETTGSSDGRFAVAGLAPGRLYLRVSAPGYRTFSIQMVLGEAPAEFAVPLEREPPRVSESVIVTPVAAAPGAPAPAPLAREYAAEELRALSSVAVDDPLRAVQALPGVAANDEFNAGFAARGSGFSSAGLYLDGVRLSAPFHTVRDVNDGYTLTIFNGEVLEAVSLVPGTAPARYGDRTGAVLSVRTRPGRGDWHGKGSFGASGAYATVEGPLGRAKTTTFLASARKSWLDYIIERVDDDPQLALGYQDVTARLTTRPHPEHAVSLLALAGRARYENTEKTPGAHEMKSAAAGTGLLLLSWRGPASPSLTLGATAFALRETGTNHDTDGFLRYDSETGSLGGQADAVWRTGAFRVEGGVEARHVTDDVLSQRWERAKPQVREEYRRDGWLWGSFAQGSWAREGGRLVVTAGGRVDGFSPVGGAVVSPRASVELALSPVTRLVAAFGRYAQFPDFHLLAGEHANPDLAPQRSRQLALALEQRLPGPLRLRVEAYDQRETDLVFNRALDWRVVDGQLWRPDPGAVWLNALSGPSRGVETVLAATGAGPVSGFVSYTWARAEREDGLGPRFPSDFDQRHTLTAFLRARLRHAVVVSTAYRYGSGFPLPGFLEERGEGVYVSAERNRYGPPAYSRFDVRLEKRFAWKRAACELFVELANATDHENVRYNEIDSVNVATGRAAIDRDKLLPRIPLFGLSVGF